MSADTCAQDSFHGQVLHSSQHKSARDHIGKKVVVVGACTSGHDISADYYQHGVGASCNNVTRAMDLTRAAQT
jgi:cation diffusion facilitator CzcD-associated flavoprotein CzcO